LYFISQSYFRLISQIFFSSFSVLTNKKSGQIFYFFLLFYLRRAALSILQLAYLKTPELQDGNADTAPWE
jgi:hypothetical protein